MIYVDQRRPCSQGKLAKEHSVQIKVATRHGHLSAATQAKIEAKVGRLSRYFERLTLIEVTVDLEHETTPAVDIRVDAEHKHDFVATEQSGALWRSIDGAVQKLEQQLRKYKEKVVDRSRKHDKSAAGSVGE